MKPTRLPDEVVPPAGAGRIVAIMVGVAALTLAANVGAYALLQWKTPNVFDELAYVKWRLVDDPPVGTDSLIVGDSSANQGVDPEVLERELGGGWINLGSVANLLTIDDAWLVDRYIQRHGPPRRVVVVHVYDVWKRRADPATFAKIPLPWGYWERLEPVLDTSLEQEAQMFAARFVPLYTSDVSLRFMLMRPWRIPSLGAPLREDGFMPMEGAEPEAVRRDAEAHLAWLGDTPPGITAANRAGLARLAELSERHGFPVYLAFGPTYTGLARAPEHAAYVAGIRQKLEAELADHPGVRLVFDAPPAYPAELLQNVEHLTLEGAQDYSRRLAEAIRRAEGEDR